MSAERLGPMPEWNLADLYNDMTAPKIAADLEHSAAEAKALQEGLKGKLAGLDAAGLAAALTRYEALQDVLGRLSSYAGLLYAADTADPQRGKFYGDMQEKLTAITMDLLFFELELNQIEDARIDRLMAEAPLKRFAPWIVDLRKEKPYQLDDKTEKLFHEKSVTGRGAFNRLFNETMTALALQSR